MGTHPKATRDDALARLRNGDTLADTSRATGVPKRTVARWAQDEGLNVSPAQARAKTEAARANLAAKWAERRETLADEISGVVTLALEETRQSLNAGAPRDAKDAATTLAILVDKAQLLTGSATERHEHVSPERTPEQEREMADVLHLVRDVA